MAEPIVLEPAAATTTDPAEVSAADADARLIRGVRWRLVAFSGGSTLLVLLILGVALYAAVASTLESNGVALLQGRAAELVRAPGPDPDRTPADFLFGSGGTVGYAFSSDGRIAIGPRFMAVTALVDQDAATAAAASGQDVRLRTIRVEGPFADEQIEVPVRQLTVPATIGQGQFFIQVLQDRSSEVRTLDTLVLVLVVGGLVVVLVAVAFGAVYARRALVPIRDSIAAQRAALRRQREFAADASHELRTPLTVIRASVEHLRRNAARPVGEVGEALQDIDAEVHHLTSMVDDLLLLARSDSGAVQLDRVPLDLADVATEAASALAQPAAARKVRVLVDPEPAPVVGDPLRLRQLATILLDNAIHHGPPDSEVRVVVRGGDTASLAVEDAGPGVRPEDTARVFDRFWRAAGAPDGGTGLGLAIAKWIAEHHGGAISVGSSSLGGARFEVRLPAGPPAVGA
jgi:signal transduction histidine kinase